MTHSLLKVNEVNLGIKDYMLKKKKLNKIFHLKYCPFHKIQIQDIQSNHISLAYYLEIRQKQS